MVAYDMHEYSTYQFSGNSMEGGWNPSPSHGPSVLEKGGSKRVKIDRIQTQPREKTGCNLTLEKNPDLSPTEYN